MIGNIETKEIKIDENNFQLTKLYAKDSYGLYLKCLAVLAPVLGNIKKTNFTIPIQTIVDIVIEKFSYDELISILKASNVTKNYKEISNSEWNMTSPILLFELFGHVLKLNVIQELTGSKKDLGQIVERLFGSKEFYKPLGDKAI